VRESSAKDRPVYANEMAIALKEELESEGFALWMGFPAHL